MPTNYEKRLKIPIIGNNKTVFTTFSGLHIATGYTRIVIGGRGPYIEFTPGLSGQIKEANTIIPEDQSYRLNDARVYYWEYRTKDVANVKIYFQIKTVSYADYKIHMYYISPFDLLADGKIIIEKLH